MNNKPYQPQQDIAELMNLYQQEQPATPTIPSREVLLLRARLLFEEAMEFVHAAGCTVVTDDETGKLEVWFDADLPKEARSWVEPNLVEMADAIGDTLVVTYGAASALGVQVQPVWDEIQRSNMSKTVVLCSDCGEILGETEGRIHHLAPLRPGHGWQWTAFRTVQKREDGKVIKPSTYSPANIAAVLAAQTAASEEAAV